MMGDREGIQEGRKLLLRQTGVGEGLCRGGSY